MLTNIERFMKDIRHNLSRSRWLARILGLPVYEGSPIRPGLVLIQVDGLSQSEFRKAVRRGEMPFLKTLIDREDYQEHSHYSGLPSSTPAVQAEIFYGIKTCVPAFSFQDRDLKKIVRMYEPDAAAKLEKRLLKNCPEPLLKGGSSYSNIYTGGAEEAHFCSSTMGIKSALESINPLGLSIIILTHMASVARVIFFIFIELFISLFDFFKKLTGSADFIKELKFIPTRVGVCILLREILVMGGKIDIERGLPIIHMNFIGFDEQAHRRGPSSMFAHWTLKGIDYAISRIWKAAQKAKWRQYDVWVYSDHGQCVATPYNKFQGYSIEEAINDALGKLNNGSPTKISKLNPGTEMQRCCLMGSHKAHAKYKHQAEITGEGGSELAALGPVGFIYPDQILNGEERELIAKELVISHKVPAVIIEDDFEQLIAFTENGNYILPEQTNELFGDDHPFLEDLKEDFECLCRHPDAGKLIIIGWRKDSPSVTFVTENGSHAGLTQEETNAFSLIPKNTQLPENSRDYLRPCDLRAAAMHFLGREVYQTKPRFKPFQTTASEHLKIMTYNVHSCIGLDGKINVNRIGKVITQFSPDIVALQELDIGRFRTGGDDQARLIAEFLEMNYHFHPAIHLEEEKYGDAILTSLPIRKVKADILPGYKPGSKREPRGALLVAVNFRGQDIYILNTHLGLSSKERLHQAKALLGKDWLEQFLQQNLPLIICGDLNAMPASSSYREISKHVKDVQLELRDHTPQKTYYSRFPTVRIDHIFINDSFEVSDICVPKSRFSQNASDHLPLIANLKLKALAD